MASAGADTLRGKRMLSLFGIMLFLLRPFRAGNVVFVPNSQIWSNPVIK
ncbi:hypothetical protein ACFSHT_30090 [Paraburkholderia silviterrae]|nr:hypothetical protein [Paraburkholderia silviterrae]